VPVQTELQKSGAPVYVTSGGGGDWVYESTIPVAVWTAFRATEYQHLVMTLDGGTLKAESIRPDGSLLDVFELVKDVPPVSSEPAPSATDADSGDGTMDGGGGGGRAGAPAATPDERAWQRSDEATGCGCRAAGRTPKAIASLFLLLAAGVRRRRRR
jgi:MYXO-CTERM domain-containing protein